MDVTHGCTGRDAGADIVRRRSTLQIEGHWKVITDHTKRDHNRSMFDEFCGGLQPPPHPQV